jgi:two-component system, NarL family, nitrate/nitrite response regulator NarL
MGDIEVVIADNQPISLSGIRSAVADEEDIRILAECQNTEHLLNAVRHYCPDVVLVSAEILKEESQEMEALEHLVTEVDETRVIVVTSERDPEFLEGALRCGARGVFQREWPVDEIPMAIRKVTNGGVWLEQSAAERVLEQALSRRKAPDNDELRIASLTPREREVIDLVCEGLRNKEITDRLHISLATISHHLTSIYRKLEVNDRTSLVVYAFKRRMVKL